MNLILSLFLPVLGLFSVKAEVLNFDPLIFFRTLEVDAPSHDSNTFPYLVQFL